MGMTGLGMAFAHMRHRKPTRRCERCGLRHGIDAAHCPHCADLSESELHAFKAQIARRRVAARRLGLWFLLGAAAIMVLLVLGLA